MISLQFKPARDGVFLSRPNRFVAVVETGGTVVKAHIATSGRLRELLVPGARLLLEEGEGRARRTPFSLKAVKHNGVWVSIDAQAPNRLLEQALRLRTLSPFAGCEFGRREPESGGGRFDFLLWERGHPVYIEVKSVTLLEKGVGLFPDAPTARGERHLRHLARLAESGLRAAVIFVIQRRDACCFAPNGDTDPRFAATLQEAAWSGVEIYAYGCLVDRSGITLNGRLPILI